MHRSKAARITTQFRVIAGVLAAGAVALAVVPTGKAGSPDGKLAPKVEGAAPPVQAVVKVDVDTAAMASAMNAISPPVKVVAKEPDDKTKPPPAPQGLAANWKFLGAIISSEYKRAIVQIDDHQRMLAEGEKVAQDGHEVEVVAIEPGAITVKDATTEKSIELAPRVKPPLTLVTPGAVRTVTQYGTNGPANGMTGAAGAAGGRAMSDEDRKRMENIRAERDAEMRKLRGMRGDKGGEKGEKGEPEEVGAETPDGGKGGK